MAKDKFEIVGFDQFQKAVVDISKRIQNTIVKDALNPISDAMAARAKSNAPVDKGRLRSAIDVRQRFVKRGAVYSSDAFVEGGVSRQDPFGAFYAHMVEFGHKTRGAGTVFGSSSFVFPQPFWEPAFVSTYGPGGAAGLQKARTSISNAILSRLNNTVPKGKI